jgi:hypothetical protein
MMWFSGEMGVGQESWSRVLLIAFCVVTGLFLGIF